MNVTLKEIVDGLAATVQTVMTWFVNMVWNNPEIVKIGMAVGAIVVVFIAAYVVAKTIQWLLSKAIAGYHFLSYRARRVWGWLRKRPTIRAVEGKFMAKWQIGELGSRIDDVIFDMEMQGRLSDAVAKRLRKKIGTAIGDWQLIPRRFHKAFLRHYFLGSKDPKTGKETPPVYQKLSGPAKVIPGPKPGENVVPVAENVVASATLERIRQKKQQVAA